MSRNIDNLDDFFTTIKSLKKERNSTYITAPLLFIFCVYAAHISAAEILPTLSSILWNTSICSSLREFSKGIQSLLNSLNSSENSAA